jgi:RNA polymerase sigma-70 factor (ECF subfamily)
MTERDTDLLLVERVRAGDKRAFELLMEKYRRKIGRLLSRMVRDPEEVEDIAQETFIKAYRALPQFRGDAAFYTWLYRIAVNTAKNYLAARNRNMLTVSDVGGDEEEGGEERYAAPDIDTPDAQLLSKQIAYAVNEAVEALPEELRTAITLREIEGMSYEDIATFMGCPIGTVRSRIFRAREAIAAKLRPILGTSEDQRW